MKTITAFLTLICVMTGGCSDTRRVSVEDTFNNLNKQSQAEAAVDKGPLQPLKLRTGTFIYKRVKSVNAKKAEQARAREFAKKDCNGPFHVITDDLESPVAVPAPTFEYRCGE